MEFKVESSMFAPNHGGGGGGGYQGRQHQAKTEDAEETTERAAEPGRPIAADVCHLPENRKSRLGLPLTIVTSEAPLDLAGLDDEIHRQLRVMTLMMIQLERNLDRRTGVAIGDVVLGA